MCNQTRETEFKDDWVFAEAHMPRFMCKQGKQANLRAAWHRFSEVKMETINKLFLNTGIFYTVWPIPSLQTKYLTIVLEKLRKVSSTNVKPTKETNFWISTSFFFLQRGNKDLFTCTYASLQDFCTSYRYRSPMRLEEGMGSRRTGSMNAGKGNQVLCKSSKHS